MGLLAYSDPVASPLGYLVSGLQNQAIADKVNDAVLGENINITVVRFVLAVDVKVLIVEIIEIIYPPTRIPVFPLMSSAALPSPPPKLHSPGVSPTMRIQCLAVAYASFVSHLAVSSSHLFFLCSGGRIDASQ